MTDKKKNSGDMPFVASRVDPAADRLGLQRSQPTRRPEPKPNPSATQVQDEPAASSKATLWPIYVILILIMGGLGWLYSLNTALAEKNEDQASLLLDYQARISLLEKLLNETDESLAMNETSIQARFKNINTEIRNLWDTTNVRNRSWIEDNQKAVAALQSGQSQQSANLANVEASVGQLDKNLSVLSDNQKNLGDSVETLASNQQDLVASQQLMSASITTLNDNQTDLSDAINLANEQIAEQSVFLAQFDEAWFKGLQQQVDQVAALQASLIEMNAELALLNAQMPQLAELKVSVSAAQSGIQALQNTVVDLDKRLTSTVGEMNESMSDLNKLSEANASKTLANAEELTNLSLVFDRLNAQIADAETAIAAASSNRATLFADIDKLKVRVQELEDASIPVINEP